MFVCVALFGFFNIIFGVSTLTWLSIIALALAGAADMISVYIRETLMQLWTPDHVRGRVNAVNMVFVGASNELGEFRAGLMAAAIGAVPAVVIGGIGSIAVAAAGLPCSPIAQGTQFAGTHLKLLPPRQASGAVVFPAWTRASI